MRCSGGGETYHDGSQVSLDLLGEGFLDLQQKVDLVLLPDAHARALRPPTTSDDEAGAAVW